MTFDLNITKADEIKAAAENDRMVAIKASCTARIKAILDANTVSNIQGAFLADTLTADEKAIFATGHAWVTDMLAACRAMVDDPDADWESDTAWPALPDGVADLAVRF